jgi:hypothetical protein
MAGWQWMDALFRHLPRKKQFHHKNSSSTAQHRISQDNGQTEETEWVIVLLVSVPVSSFFTPLASDPPDTRLEKLETAGFALKI